MKKLIFKVGTGYQFDDGNYDKNVDCYNLWLKMQKRQ